MPAAMTLISSQTLGSAVPTVTFTSFPSTYRDLRIVFNGGMTVTASMFIRMNGDTTTANYSDVWMRGNGTSPASSSDNGTIAGSRISFDSNPVTNSNQLLTTIDILDYSQTDKHKTTLARGNDAGSETSAFAARWASTSAVTTVLLWLGGSSNFTAGSTFSLYGVSA